MADRYRYRILRDDEYVKLGLPGVKMPPGAIAAVIEDTEDGNRIVGQWMAGNTVILEGLQILPEYRNKPGVARRLFEGMMRVLVYRNVPAVLTLIQSPEVEALADKAGFVKLPGSVWQKDLRR